MLINHEPVTMCLVCLPPGFLAIDSSYFWYIILRIHLAAIGWNTWIYNQNFKTSKIYNLRTFEIYIKIYKQIKNDTKGNNEEYMKTEKRKWEPAILH